MSTALSVWYRTFFIMALVLLLLPGLVAVCQWSFNAFEPVTISSLSFAPVDLGILKPGESCDFECEIRNQSTRTINILPPKPSCGCVSVNNGRSILKPTDSIKLRFKFRSPDSPGLFNEKILLQAADFSNVFWNIDIHGQVVADVWAVPSKINLISNSDQYDESVVQIHHNKGTSIGEIRGDSTDIHVDRVKDEEGVQIVRIALSSTAKTNPTIGHGTINITASQNPEETLLNIPVDWSPLPKMDWIPRKIRLDDFGDSRDAPRRMLVIRGLAQDEIGHLKVEPLVAWVRVLSMDVTNDIVQVQLAFDASIMPERFDQGLLRFCLEGRGCETVVGAGRR